MDLYANLKYIYLGPTFVCLFVFLYFLHKFEIQILSSKVRTSHLPDIKDSMLELGLGLCWRLGGTVKVSVRAMPMIANER